MDKLNNEEIRKRFGANIRALRKSRGYSQQKFANALGIGITQATVSSWEVGLREPEFSVVFEIANKFKVPVSSLIPIDQTGMDEDLNQQFIDMIHQNPRICATFDKTKYFDDKQMGVVMSVIDAIAKERETQEE